MDNTSELSNPVPNMRTMDTGLKPRVKIPSISFAENERLLTVGAGLAIGVLGSGVALLLVLEGVVVTFGLVIGILVGLYLLTSLDAALIVVMATVALLPFGTFPVKIAFTPSLIDCALAGFLTVYLFQWMTGKRREFHLTPVSWTIFLLIGVVIFTFILGTGTARPNMNLMKTFVELLLSLSMGLILADVANNLITLRRIVMILLLTGAVSAVVGVILWQLPDDTAEQLLVRLARFGYPNGGVLHYREDGVEVLNERAIGTWIAPNTYGSFLMMVGALAGVQVVAKYPVVKWRWLAVVCFGAIGAALFLSDSRGAFLGLVMGLGAVAMLRYRQLLFAGALVAVLALFLPQTQAYISRFEAGFTGADLETQMRLGEYKDALNLIERYPVFGVGFSGVPEIDLYTAVSSTYLTIAVYMGVVGLLIYGIAIASILGWGLRWWNAIKQDDWLVDVWLGLLAGIIGALVGGIFDHFYFNPQFQATSFLLWSFIGLFLAATRIVWERSLETE